MSSQSIDVRRATLGDLDVIVAFNRAMAEETEDKPLDPGTLTAGVRAALQDPSLCLYFVAETDGTVVGQTMVTLEWSDWRNGYFWWIQSVYVDQRFRRRGVFRSLYCHIRDLARGHSDVLGLRLYVHRDNRSAIETYQDLGMTLSEYLVCEEEWAPPATGAGL